LIEPSQVHCGVEIDKNKKELNYFVGANDGLASCQSPNVLCCTIYRNEKDKKFEFDHFQKWCDLENGTSNGTSNETVSRILFQLDSQYPNCPGKMEIVSTRLQTGVRKKKIDFQSQTVNRLRLPISLDLSCG